MRIVIIGAGAIGTTLAVSLARAWEEVSLLVTPEAIPASGALQAIVDHAATGEQRWAIMPAIGSLTEACDLIILAVPTPALPAAAQLAAQAPGAPPLLTVQQTPGIEGTIAASLGQGRIAGALPAFAAIWQGAGHARLLGDLGMSLAASADPQIIALLEKAFPVYLIPDLDALRWTRLLLQAPMLLGDLSDRPFAVIRDHRRLEAIAIALLREATHVAEAAGLPLAPLPGLALDKLRRLHTVPGLFAARAAQPFLAYAMRGPGEIGKPSESEPSPLRTHLRRHRPTEIDDLQGMLVRLGEKLQIPTPAIARAVALVHEVERTGTFFTTETLAQALRGL